MAQGKEIKNLFASVRDAAVGVYNTAKSKINKLRATPKKKKKDKKKRRVDIYSQGQKRKAAMEAAGNYSSK